MRPFPAFRPGTISSEARRSGISRSVALMPRDWLRGRERIYLDASGMNSPAIDPRSMKPPSHYAEFYARPGAMHSAFAPVPLNPQGCRGQQGVNDKQVDNAGARDWRSGFIRGERGDRHAKCRR